jgi:small subunit ribosomal protein S2
MPSNITMKQLLEAGVHFGHQSRRWNPKMARYIFTERNGIYIIDLKKTLRLVKECMKFICESVAAGKTVLFVGTKKQARESIQKAAEGCGMYYVNNRWLGGMLTNFKTIRHSIVRLIELEKMWEDGTINRYSKKEISRLDREKNSLSKNLSGLKKMKEMPGVVFIVDPHKEHIAVHEARKLKIPIVAIVDTNCDPDLIDYVIPGNDDAIRAIKLMAEQSKLACIEGLMEQQAIEGVDPQGLSEEIADALGIPVPQSLTPPPSEYGNPNYYKVKQAQQAQRQAAQAAQATPAEAAPVNEKSSAPAAPAKPAAPAAPATPVPAEKPAAPATQEAPAAPAPETTS